MEGHAKSPLATREARRSRHSTPNGRRSQAPDDPPMKRTKTRTKKPANNRKKPTKRTLQNAAIQHAFVSVGFAEVGVAQLVLLSKRPTGGMIGVFHLDLRGVGVIDCFAQTQLNAADYSGALHEAKTDLEMMPIPSDDARKILLACLRYSQQLGQGPVHPEEIAGLFIDDLDAMMGTVSAPKTAIDKTLSELLNWSEAAPPIGIPPGPHLSPEQRLNAHVEMKLETHVAEISRAAGEIERLVGRQELRPLLESFLSRADHGPSFLQGSAGMVQ